MTDYSTSVMPSSLPSPSPSPSPSTSLFLLSSPSPSPSSSPPPLSSPSSSLRFVETQLANFSVAPGPRHSTFTPHGPTNNYTLFSQEGSNKILWDPSLDPVFNGKKLPSSPSPPPLPLDNLQTIFKNTTDADTDTQTNTEAKTGTDSNANANINAEASTDSNANTVNIDIKTEILEKNLKYAEKKRNEWTKRCQLIKNKLKEAKTQHNWRSRSPKKSPSHSSTSLFSSFSSNRRPSSYSSFRTNQPKKCFRCYVCHNSFRNQIDLDAHCSKKEHFCCRTCTRASGGSFCLFESRSKLCTHLKTSHSPHE